jgi:hypothetical protein
VSDREEQMSRPAGIYASTLTRRGRTWRRWRIRRRAFAARATAMSTVVAGAAVAVAAAERFAA